MSSALIVGGVEGPRIEGFRSSPFLFLLQAWWGLGRGGPAFLGPFFANLFLPSFPDFNVRHAILFRLPHLEVLSPPTFLVFLQASA